MQMALNSRMRLVFISVIALPQFFLANRHRRAVRVALFQAILSLSTAFPVMKIAPANAGGGIRNPEATDGSEAND